MFDVAPTELLVLGTVALLVIPPKDLPKAMRIAGHWVGRARGVARQFRSGFDEIIRESELAEMERKWRAENERIMREHPFAPPAPPVDVAALPPPDASTPHEDDSPPVMVERPRVVAAPAAAAPPPPDVTPS